MLDNLTNFLLVAQEGPLLIESVNADEVVNEVVSGAVVMSTWANLGYLVAAVLFILGIKGMTHPRTAVRGNLFGSLGMLTAVLVTLYVTKVPLIIWLAGILVGTAGGVWLARTIQMTQMPQLVALFNGFGGIASVLVAGAEVIRRTSATTDIVATDVAVAGVAAGLTGLIGSVTFTGSLIAAAKLQELPFTDNCQPTTANFNLPIGIIGTSNRIENVDGTGNVEISPDGNESLRLTSSTLE